MDKTPNKSHHQRSHDRGKTSLFVGGIIVLIISITPFIFYSYESFPDSKVWETSFFKITTSYPSIAHLAWYSLGKGIPLLLFFLWFFTCRHWWHWIILVPITMYSFQLWAIINESNNLDVLEIYYVVPLLIVLVPAVYLIRAKLFNEVRGNDLKSFEEDLLVKKTLWEQIKDLFQ
ncbi:MAG: hypothetical protein ACI83B_000722 [Sediminicola sp.]|jgi:hypothetical protein